MFEVALELLIHRARRVFHAPLFKKEMFADPYPVYARVRSEKTRSTGTRPTAVGC
jgi:hypothetical protein